MRGYIILLTFGEPEVPDEDRITHNLKHIFRANRQIVGFDPRIFRPDSCACAVDLTALCLSDMGGV